MKRSDLKARCSSWRRFSLLTIVALGAIATAAPTMQSQQASSAILSTVKHPEVHVPLTGTSTLAPTAYLHYLLALQFASDGIQHEALRELALSLRAQRDGNPAAGLAFQLITEQRQDVHITLCCNTGNILTASYSPDGARILTVSDDKIARVWDAHTGRLLAGPLHHDTDILAAPGAKTAVSSRPARGMSSCTFGTPRRANHRVRPSTWRTR